MLLLSMGSSAASVAVLLRNVGGLPRSHTLGGFLGVGCWVPGLSGVSGPGEIKIAPPLPWPGDGPGPAIAALRSKLT